MMMLSIRLATASATALIPNLLILETHGTQLQFYHSPM